MVGDAESKDVQGGFLNFGMLKTMQLLPHAAALCHGTPHTGEGLQYSAGDRQTYVEL